MKEKVGELEDEVREVFFRRLSKYLTAVVHGLYVKRGLLVMFQNWFQKDMTSNELTAVTVDITPLTKEFDFPNISVLPDDKANLCK